MNISITVTADELDIICAALKDRAEKAIHEDDRFPGRGYKQRAEVAIKLLKQLEKANETL